MSRRPVYELVDAETIDATEQLAAVLAEEVRRTIGCSVKHEGNSFYFRRYGLSCNVFVVEMNAHYVLRKGTGLSPILFDINLADPTSVEQLIARIKEHPAILARRILRLEEYWRFVLAPIVEKYQQTKNEELLQTLETAVGLLSREEVKKINSWWVSLTGAKQSARRLLRKIHRDVSKRNNDRAD